MKKLNMKKVESECRIYGFLAFCFTILAIAAIDRLCPFQMTLCWKYLAVCSICAGGCLAKCFWLGNLPKFKKTR